MWLLKKIHVHQKRRGRPRRRPKKVAADKGYDSKELRGYFRNRGIKPEISKRHWKNKPHRGRPPEKTVARYVVERAFSWLQRKFRRIVIRWERLPKCFEAFVTHIPAKTFLPK